MQRMNTHVQSKSNTATIIIICFFMILLVATPTDGQENQEVSEDNSEFNFRIDIEPNQLVIIIEGDNAVDLSDLGFEAVMNGRSTLYMLSDFDDVYSAEIDGPVCILLHDGNQGSLPTLCDAVFTDIYEVANDDIFWVDSTGSLRSFVITHGTNQTGYCLAGELTCNVSYREQLPELESPEEPSINIEWDSNSLTVVVSGPYGISLEGFGIYVPNTDDGIQIDELLAFNSLRFDYLITPICFQLVIEDELSNFSDECPEGTRAIDIIPIRSRFWWDDNNKRLEIRFDGTVIDSCNNGGFCSVDGWEFFVTEDMSED
ncbi:MAG: hypothetical protein AAFV98_02925 [Chloroflexota bacterium]